MKIEELEDYTELPLYPDLLPDPRFSRCIVARLDTGKIVGWCFVQTLVCIEPIYVHSEFRGTRIAHDMFNKAKEGLQKGGLFDEFYCHTSLPEVVNYLERLGLQDRGEKVLVGKVNPNGVIS